MLIIAVSDQKLNRKQEALSLEDLVMVKRLSVTIHENKGLSEGFRKAYTGFLKVGM